MNEEIGFRFATEEDIPELLRLIGDLAEHQKAREHALATPELIRRWMFEEGSAEALVVEHASDGLVGFAIFYRTFSTWVGKCGMYLEDLFIDSRYRGSGVGRALMAELARICEEREWGRFDWTCLDWNTPSLGFYRSIGAEQLNTWIHHRLSGDALVSLAQEAKDE